MHRAWNGINEIMVYELLLNIVNLLLHYTLHIMYGYMNKINNIIKLYLPQLTIPNVNNNIPITYFDEI